MPTRPTLLRLALMLVITASAAMVTAAPTFAQDGAADTVNVELILDSSGSMAERIGTQTRMQIAKRVLTHVVEAIPERPGVNVGFRIYGHGGDNTAAGRAVSCRSSDLLVPIDGVDKAAIAGHVAAAQPTGWTPLAYSLGRAGADMPVGGDGVVNAVVLLTDGLETCGGDPCAVAAAMHGSDAQLITHVVSFAVDRAERQTLQCIADEGGGLLLGAQDADQLSGALFTILGDLDVVSTTGTLELQSVDGIWPDATAVCQGPVTDAQPDGVPVTVRFDRSNVAEVPVGVCTLTWSEATGDVSRARVVIDADRRTVVTGGLVAPPQGNGERYVMRALGGQVRLWDGPIEVGDRIWVRPGRYNLELDPRVGDPVLIWASLSVGAGTVVHLDAGTEP